MERSHAKRVPATPYPSSSDSDILSKAINELRAIDKEASLKRADLASLEKKRENIKRVIEAINGKTPQINDAIERPPAHSSKVYSNVVALFREQSNKNEWSTPDVKQALERKGVVADTARVHNTLAYLAREGKLLRISRGRYLVIPLWIRD